MVADEHDRRRHRLWAGAHAWVSQGTSSAYEAVFGPVVEELKELCGISPTTRCSRILARSLAHEHEDRRRRETVRES